MKYCLFLFSCIEDCLKSVELLPDRNSVSTAEWDEAVRQLFRQYVLTDLAFHPVTTHRFQKMLKNAANFFHGIREGSFHIDPSSRPYFQVDLEQAKLQQVQETELQRQLDILQASKNCGIQIPDNVMQQASISPCDWMPTLDATGISNEVHGEQVIVSSLCERAIDRKLSGEPFTQFPIITGPPGTGKTYLMMGAACYAISRGLRVSVLSVTGERARSLGGSHIHLVFGVPVSNIQV